MKPVRSRLDSVSDSGLKSSSDSASRELLPHQELESAGQGVKRVDRNLLLSCRRA